MPEITRLAQWKRMRYRSVRCNSKEVCRCFLDGEEALALKPGASCESRTVMMIAGCARCNVLASLCAPCKLCACVPFHRI